MKNMRWIEDNDAYISRQGDTLRGMSDFGIITGFHVERIGETASVRVFPGKALISNSVVELATIYDGLQPLNIYNGTEVFVVLSLLDNETTTTNRYSETVWESRYHTYSLSMVDIHAYVPGNNIVLAHCRYSKNTQYPNDPGSVNIINVPRNIFGIFSSLAEASVPEVTSKLATGDTIAVRVKHTTTIGSQVLVSEQVEIYSWDYIQDPILLKNLTHPDPMHANFDAYGIWAQDQGFGLTTPMLQYSIPDISDPMQNVGWIEHPTHAWNLASAQDHGIDASYFSQLIGISVDIDNSNVRYDFVRPVFSGTDIEHRNRASSFPTSTNIHGVGFNDIGYDSLPLHAQVFDSGFGIASMTTHGVLGQLYAERVLNQNISVDYFGDVTGVLANRYLKLKHVPVGVAHLLEVTTGNNVAYELLHDVVVLGPDFVGGSFSTYPVFVRTIPYVVGDRVVRKDSLGIDHLYSTIYDWDMPDSTEPDGFDVSYFEELYRVDLDVGYYYISDLEYYTTSDNFVYVRQNNNNSLVTEGKIVDPNNTNTSKEFNLGQYKDVPLDKMTLACDSQGNLVCSETILDRADISTRRASQSGFNKQFPASSQIKFHLSRTPKTYDLAPPDGLLGLVESVTTGNVTTEMFNAPSSTAAHQSILTSSAFHGRIRLFYTYGLFDQDIHTTTSQLSDFSGTYNLENAQLVEDVNYVPRDSWEYSYKDKKVVVSSDVYRIGRTYTVVRPATESPRNHRGYIEVVGTAPKPLGTSATATLTITEYARLSIGDAITIAFGDNKQVTKTLQAQGGSAYTGFEQGSDIQTTLHNIAVAFNTDPVFNQYCTAISGALSCIFLAKQPGPAANAYVLTSSSINTSMKTTVFAGGAEHVFKLEDDIAGLVVGISDKMLYDDASYYSVWSTLNLDDAETSPDTYYRVAVVVDDNSGFIKHTLDSSEIESSSGDVLDISKELKITIQVSGTDSEGTELSESVVIDSSNFCDIQNHRVLNPYVFVRTKNVYSSITRWSCLDITNAGSSILVILAEAATGTRDLFDVVDLSWTGSRLKYIRDRRVFIDATTNKPTSTVAAEALSNIAALLQL